MQQQKDDMKNKGIRSGMRFPVIYPEETRSNKLLNSSVFRTVKTSIQTFLVLWE